MPVAKLIGQRLTEAAAEKPVRAGVLSFVIPMMNLAILLVCTAMLSGQSYNPFLYYRF